MFLFLVLINNISHNNAGQRMTRIYDWSSSPDCPPIYMPAITSNPKALTARFWCEEETVLFRLDLSVLGWGLNCPSYRHHWSAKDKAYHWVTVPCWNCQPSRHLAQNSRAFAYYFNVPEMIHNWVNPLHCACD